MNKRKFLNQEIISIQQMPLPSSLVFYDDIDETCPECGVVYISFHPNNNCKFGIVKNIVEE